MNKKGDTIVLESVIFIILNIVFTAVLLIFILNSSYGAVIYEQTYAKQIVLAIDEAKPNMDIILDMNEAIEVAKKYNLDKGETSDSILSKAVILDKENNRIKVSLSGKGGGYSFQYFLGYDVELETRGVYLLIRIGNKIK